MKIKVATTLVLLLVMLGPGAAAHAEQPGFALPDLQGEVHELSDYRGKWVVVNYWATWCPPCLDEIPELVAFHDAHAPDKAVVLGINYEEADRDYLEGFVEQYFVSYPILIGELKAKTPFGLLYGLPTTYVVSPQGEVVESHTGGVTQQYLERVIDEQATESTTVSNE